MTFVQLTDLLVMNLLHAVDVTFMLDLNGALLADKLVDALRLLFQETHLFLDCHFLIADDSLLVLIKLFILLQCDVKLTQLKLISIDNILNINLMRLLNLQLLLIMTFDQLLDLHGIPLVNLRGDLIPNIVIHLLNLLKDSSLEFRTCACATRELILTVMVSAPVPTTDLKLKLLNNLHLLLEDLLDADHLSLMRIVIK